MNIISKALLSFFLFFLFSCTTTVDEDSNTVKIESKTGSFGLEY